MLTPFNAALLAKRAVSLSRRAYTMSLKLEKAAGKLDEFTKAIDKAPSPTKMSGDVWSGSGRATHAGNGHAAGHVSIDDIVVPGSKPVPKAAVKLPTKAGPAASSSKVPKPVSPHAPHVPQGFNDAARTRIFKTLDDAARARAKDMMDDFDDALATWAKKKSDQAYTDNLNRLHRYGAAYARMLAARNKYNNACAIVRDGGHFNSILAAARSEFDAASAALIAA